MRAVTLPQPHASLVAAGVQTIVTLSRATDWRGDLLIHAGAQKLSLAQAWEAWRAVRRAWLPSPLGAVVAEARVTDCVPARD